MIAPKVGFVSIVGAGPGDPELLTVRALNRIRTAHVIAYDRLVPEAILALADRECEMICVGRRCGEGVLPYAVHPTVLAYAKAGRDVVRLKCGDPMVFGRGGEEIAVLERHGIPYEVVPGITAALGAASSIGIPLTLRGVASSVTFATGHGAGDPSDGMCDGPDLAQGGGTMVLYMAARNLEHNAERLMDSGCPGETPAVLVANATRPDQVVIKDTLAGLAQRVPPGLRTAPALVIVGKVVEAGLEDSVPDEILRVSQAELGNPSRAVSVCGVSLVDAALPLSFRESSSRGDNFG